MKNWKTFATGLITIGLIGLKVATHPAGTTVEDVGAIVAGLGLMLAKQHNVTGGTVPQAGGTEPANHEERAAALNN